MPKAFLRSVFLDTTKNLSVSEGTESNEAAAKFIDVACTTVRHISDTTTATCKYAKHCNSLVWRRGGAVSAKQSATHIVE